MKTKSVLLSTSKMANFHGLIDKISNRQLERVSVTRLLGLKFQGKLKWNDHVKDIANASYGVLCPLQKLKLLQTFTYVRDWQSRLYYRGSTLL